MNELLEVLSSLLVLGGLLLGCCVTAILAVILMKLLFMGYAWLGI